MARRNPTEKPAPFPPEIDRTHFASWVSGFTDGEGHLGLELVQNGARPTPRAKFQIKLRIDDEDVLKLIRSFFGCGNVTRYRRGGREGWAPQAVYIVNPANELATIIVPHFDKFPLIAKKRHDFHVWRKGVLLCDAVVCRGRRGCGFRRGQEMSWTEDEIAEFAALAESLKAARKYQAPAIEAPQPGRRPLPLFDGLAD